jgi:hypothetical protein
MKKKLDTQAYCIIQRERETDRERKTYKKKLDKQAYCIIHRERESERERDRNI